MGRDSCRFGLAILLLAISTISVAVQAQVDTGVHQPADKTLADGLYMSGGWTATYTANYATVTLSVGAVNNDSSTRTTGTLRFEYWAVASQPARAAGFNGYRLAVFPNLGQLQPRTHFSNPSQTTAMQVPPDGTYWLVVLLSEYDPQNCSSADGFCLVDSLISDQTRTFGVPVPAANYTDIWWNPNESGWGLTIADHQTQIFGVWYTYRQDGQSTWFTIPGGTFSQGRRIFTGDIYQTTGPPYNTTFDPNQVHATRVGSATIDFAPPGLAAGTARFTYTVGSASGSKQIQRMSFGDAPAAWGSDFSDIFNDPTKPGWGLTVAQHGGTLFAVWYTYDVSGQPIFLVLPGATVNTPSTFSGDIYVTSGPYFGNATFDPSLVQSNSVGSVVLDFDTGSTAAMMEKSTCPRPRGCTGRLHTRVGSWLGTWMTLPTRYGNAAPDTPAPTCDIIYSDWSQCSGGSQLRSETGRVPPGCSATPEPTARACTPAANACRAYLGTWGDCQPSNTQTFTEQERVPPGCVGTPQTTRSCTYTLCSYSFGPPYGACVNGFRTHTVTPYPVGCHPGNFFSPTEPCSDNVPQGFPTNLTPGTYRLDGRVCTSVTGCTSVPPQFVQYTDAQSFAAAVTGALSGLAPVAGCSQSTSFTPFNGSTFSATLSITCSSPDPGIPPVTAQVIMTVTKV